MGSEAESSPPVAAFRALISEWRAARYPENRAYIMRHNPAAWEALSYMADLSRNTARDRLLAGVRTGITQ